MKLNARQLRTLVEGVIKETDATGYGVEDALSDQLEDFVTEFIRECQWMYSEDDPVQSRYGKEAWDLQCESAGEALDKAIVAVMDQIVKRLHGGEFY